MINNIDFDLITALIKFIFNINLIFFIFFLAIVLCKKLFYTIFNFD